MKFFLKLCLILAFGLQPLRANQRLHVYLVTDASFAGDSAAVQSVGNALKKAKSGAKLVHIDVKHFTKLSPQSPCVIVTANSYGAAFLKKHNRHKCLKVNMSHQVADYISDHINYMDLLALPKHLLPPSNLSRAKIQLVRIPGMPHLVTQEVLKDAYKKNATVFPDVLHKKVYIIMLGGDAPRPDGSIMTFKVSDLDPVLKALNKTGPEKSSVWLFNGPRTGKFAGGKEVRDAHHSPKLDHTTQKAIDRLAHHGFIDGKSLKVFNFEFGKPSPYKAALGYLLARGGALYLPGESVSMISEAYDIQELAKKTSIYLTSSMNSEHHAFVRSNDNFKVLNANPTKQKASQPAPAAEIIAEAILKHTKLRNTHAKTN